MSYHIDRRDVREAIVIIRKCRAEVQSAGQWSFEAWKLLFNAELYLRDCMEIYADVHAQAELDL